MTAGGGASARARSFGIPAVEVDGNDVLAVDAATAELVSAIRAGGGPRFLHAHTYRLTGHTGSDPAAYRPADEVAARRQEEPIGRAAELLAGAGVPAEALEADAAEATAEMRKAYAAAVAAPFPPAEEAFTAVQDAGDPRREAF
jgi:pyruvate dehydrogenase E1 component alpha subunit